MTNTDYSKMTDQELNEAAALAMGWEVQRNGHLAVAYTSGPYTDDPVDFPRKNYRLIWDHQPKGDICFHPASDSNHSAEFMAFVSSLDHNHAWRWNIWQTHNPDVWRVALVIQDNMIVIAGFECSFLARAETICCLIACDVMKKEETKQ